MKKSILLVLPFCPVNVGEYATLLEKVAILMRATEMSLLQSLPFSAMGIMIIWEITVIDKTKADCVVRVVTQTRGGNISALCIDGLVEARDMFLVEGDIKFRLESSCIVTSESVQIPFSIADEGFRVAEFLFSHFKKTVRP